MIRIPLTVSIVSTMQRSAPVDFARTVRPVLNFEHLRNC
jgi:hypothetical protein